MARITGVRSIVIIDDEPVTRKILAALIGSVSNSYKVIEFGCAQQALDWVVQHSAALVITDYKMPEMNGIEFIRRFREQQSARGVPVVLVSADGDEGIRDRALFAGADEFWLKPVDHRSCRDRCQSLLG